jgi:hypothetical protein
MKKDVIFDLMKEVLTQDDRLVFGYVYGSFVKEKSFRQFSLFVPACG